MERGGEVRKWKESAEREAYSWSGFSGFSDMANADGRLHG